MRGEHLALDAKYGSFVATSGNVVLVGQAHELGLRPRPHRQAVPLQFDIEAIAEQFLEPLRSSASAASSWPATISVLSKPFGPPVSAIRPRLCCSSASQRDVRRVARLHVEMRLAREFHQVRVAGFVSAPGARWRRSAVRRRAPCAPRLGALGLQRELTADDRLHARLSSAPRRCRRGRTDCSCR